MKSKYEDQYRDILASITATEKSITFKEGDLQKFVEQKLDALVKK